jgi:hypothetical protein
MDDKEAKKLLQEHSKALQKLLGDDLKSEALEQAKGAKLAKKTFLGRIKELPVVEKISSLGAAGTVAVGTAAATQADLAVNYTEIVVAQVAEDVWEGIIEPPGFIDSFVDFDSLYVWGQDVIAEKVAEVSELQQTSQPSAETADPKPAPSASSQGTDDGKPSQNKPTESSQESKAEKSETKESKSSNESDQESQEEAEQEQPQQEQTEESQQSQEKSSFNQITESIERVNTPIDIDDSIKPHSEVTRSVSPAN